MRKLANFVQKSNWYLLTNLIWLSTSVDFWQSQIKRLNSKINSNQTKLSGATVSFRVELKSVWSVYFIRINWTVATIVSRFSSLANNQSYRYESQIFIFNIAPNCFLARASSTKVEGRRRFVEVNERAQCKEQSKLKAKKKA